jgi:hypothetical protein
MWTRPAAERSFRMPGSAATARTTASARWVAKVGLAGFERYYPHQLAESAGQEGQG